jgi:hypothetical protein
MVISRIFLTQMEQGYSSSQALLTG